MTQILTCKTCGGIIGKDCLDIRKCELNSFLRIQPKKSKEELWNEIRSEVRQIREEIKLVKAELKKIKSGKD